MTTRRQERHEEPWGRYAPEVRDSHWVMAYGNWLKELGYATRKIGVQWVSLADAA